MAPDTLGDKHTYTHTEGLLWTRARDFYLTIHSTHNRLTSMPPVACGIRTSNRRKQAAADPRLRRRGRRCRPVCTLEAYVYTNFDRPFMVSNNTTSVSQGTQPVCNACLAPHVCLYFASRLFLLVRRPHFSVFVYVHVRWFHFVPVYLHRPKLAPERYKRPRLRMDPKRSVCHKRASGQL